MQGSCLAGGNIGSTSYQAVATTRNTRPGYDSCAISESGVFIPIRVHFEIDGEHENAILRDAGGRKEILSAVCKCPCVSGISIRHTEISNRGQFVRRLCWLAKADLKTYVYLNY